MKIILIVVTLIIPPLVVPYFRIPTLEKINCVAEYINLNNAYLKKTKYCWYIPYSSKTKPTTLTKYLRIESAVNKWHLITTDKSFTKVHTIISQFKKIEDFILTKKSLDLDIFLRFHIKKVLRTLRDKRTNHILSIYQAEEYTNDLYKKLIEANDLVKINSFMKESIIVSPN